MCFNLHNPDIFRNLEKYLGPLFQKVLDISMCKHMQNLIWMNFVIPTEEMHLV